MSVTSSLRCEYTNNLQSPTFPNTNAHFLFFLSFFKFNFLVVGRSEAWDPPETSSREELDVEIPLSELAELPPEIPGCRVSPLERSSGSFSDSSFIRSEERRVGKEC